MRLFERLRVLHRAWRYRLRADRDEIRFLAQRQLAGRTVIDLGAHKGVYSYWMHRYVGPRGLVLAFEPQPELVAYLQAMKTAFHMKQLTIVPAAVSSRSGATTLVRPRRHWGGASLEMEPAADRDSIAVPLISLDEYVAQNKVPRIAFIKCDVELHEEQAFRGAEGILAEHQPELLFECYHSVVSRGTFFPYLEGLGYEGYFFHQGKLTPRERFEELRGELHAHFLNYVFLPRRRKARAA